MFESKFEVERAWVGGPLRKVGSGNGSPSKYVCGVCQRSSVGVYRLETNPQTREWACYGCFRTPGKPLGSGLPDSAVRPTEVAA